MATPGISVGSLIDACVLIYRLGVKYRDAPPQFEEIAEKSKSVAVVLERINREIAIEGSVADSAGSQAYSQLYDILTGLSRDADALRALVGKYDRIHDEGYGRRAWFQIKESNDLTDLRRHMGWHEQRLQMWSTAMVWSPHRRLEGGPREILAAIRALDALPKDRTRAVLRDLARRDTGPLEAELRRAGMSARDVDASIGAAVEYALADALEQVRMASRVRSSVAAAAAAADPPKGPRRPPSFWSSDPPWEGSKGVPTVPPPPYPEARKARERGATRWFGPRDGDDGSGGSGGGVVAKLATSSARVARDDAEFKDLLQRYSRSSGGSAARDEAPRVVLERRLEGAGASGRLASSIMVTREDSFGAGPPRRSTTEFKEEDSGGDDASAAPSTPRLEGSSRRAARDKSPGAEKKAKSPGAEKKAKSPEPDTPMSPGSERGKGKGKAAATTRDAPTRAAPPPTLMVQRSMSTTGGRPAQRYRDEKTTTRYRVARTPTSTSAEGPAPRDPQVLIVPAAPRRHARRSSELPPPRPSASPLLAVPDAGPRDRPSSAPDPERNARSPRSRRPSADGRETKREREGAVGLGLEGGEWPRETRYEREGGEVVVIEERAPRRRNRRAGSRDAGARDSSTHSYVRRRPESREPSAEGHGEGRSIRMISRMDRIDSAGQDEGPAEGGGGGGRSAGKGKGP